MKISADSILLGSWCRSEGLFILDIGTGCGILSLMCAQRNHKAIIHAIDIDTNSIDEASENFNASPWNVRLFAERVDFIEYCPDIKYDLIISNPPYFDSGVHQPNTSREKARHDSSLPLESLLSKSTDLLSKKGRIALILPSNRMNQLKRGAEKCGLTIKRCCKIKGHDKAQEKRIMVELIPDDSISSNNIIKEESIILRNSTGSPSEEYRRLCQDFYLDF